MGRPKLPKKAARSVMVGTKITPDTDAALRRVAKRMKLTRCAIVDLAIRELVDRFKANGR